MHKDLITGARTRLIIAETALTRARQEFTEPAVAANLADTADAVNTAIVKLNRAIKALEKA